MNFVILKIARWIRYHLAAGPDKEEHNIPGTEPKLEFGDLDDDGRPMHVATTYNNDGFELWLGYRWKWHVFYKDKDARRLAWFILWDWWAKSTWFGLKRRIWYWANRQIVKSYTGIGKRRSAELRGRETQ